MTATRIPPLLQTTLDYFTQQVTEYAETRLAIVDPYRQPGVPKQFGSSLMRSYLRDCARQLKCPFVVVELWGRKTDEFQANITFKKLKRTEPLAAGFMVAAKQFPTSWGRQTDRQHEIVQITKRKTVYDFIVYNEQRFDEWVHQCKTNEFYRTALGLPKKSSLPNPLREASMENRI